MGKGKKTIPTSLSNTHSFGGGFVTFFMTQIISFLIGQLVHTFTDNAFLQFFLLGIFVFDYLPVILSLFIVLLVYVKIVRPQGGHTGYYFLGHKSIRSTELYITIERTLFATSINDQFTVRATDNPYTVKTLFEQGFDCVCEKDTLIFLRKRK